MGDYLADLLRSDPEPPRPIALGAFLTAWDAVTGWNTVSIGATNYTDLPAVRAAVSGVGPVLILFTPEPVIVGTVTPADPR
jgi:hypothetical protein